jgi:tetratricopeptide (TPR) repeat protein
MNNLERELQKVDTLLEHQDYKKALEILEELHQGNIESNIVEEKLIKALFSYAFYLTDEIIAKDDEAVDLFHKILDIEPENYKALYNLGITYDNLDKPKKALEYLKKALEINPNHKYSYYNIGLIYENQDEPVKALEFYNRALQIDPKFLYAQHARNAVRNILDHQESSKKKDFSKVRKKLQSYGLNFDNIEKLKSLLEMSNKIRLNMIQDVIGLERERLLDLLLYLGKNYNFKMDGDFLVVNKKGLKRLLGDV